MDTTKAERVLSTGNVPLWGRATVYKGIRMRSRLEANFAAEMDRRGRSWVYEPEAFASERGQYLPDFRLDDSVTGTTYVELKGQTDDVPGVQRRMEIIWESDRTCHLAVLVQSAKEYWNGCPQVYGPDALEAYVESGWGEGVAESLDWSGRTGEPYTSALDPILFGSAIAQGRCPWHGRLFGWWR